MNERYDLTPAALYARVSSDRQDVDLSVAAQLRALRDYAEKNGYVVAREYIDEAESGRIADRPQFRRMLDEASLSDSPFPGNPCLEILAIHPQAGARRGLQVHAPQAGHQGNLHHRARRRLPHRQADGGHHREPGRILLGKSCPGGFAGNAGGRLPWLLDFHLLPLRLPEGAGPGRSQEAPQAGA